MTAPYNPAGDAHTQSLPLPSATPSPAAYALPQPLPPRTNILAVISLVASLSTIFTGFGFIVGIIAGHYAVRQIEDRGEVGRGYAKAGLLIGYVCLGILVALALCLLIGVLVLAQAPGLTS